MWEIYLTDQVLAWLDGLITDNAVTHRRVVIAIEALAEGGPELGRPLVDRIKGSNIHHLKELRPGSSGASEVRILFAFDPWRSSILLVAGNKAGRWTQWYREAIPRAEELYERYLQERAAEEETGQ